VQGSWIPDKDSRSRHDDRPRPRGQPGRGRELGNGRRTRRSAWRAAATSARTDAIACAGPVGRARAGRATRYRALRRERARWRPLRTRPRSLQLLHTSRSDGSASWRGQALGRVSLLSRNRCPPGVAAFRSYHCGEASVAVQASADLRSWSRRRPSTSTSRLVQHATRRPSTRARAVSSSMRRFCAGLVLSC
jgi:hypothetical protein